MKKYLGGYMGAYAAIGYPVVCIILPIVFAICIILMAHEIDFWVIILVLFSVFYSVFCVIALIIKEGAAKAYSWGNFTEDRIQVKTLFSKRYEIEYDKCASVGIGRYTHGIWNSGMGPKIYYIFFSYKPFDEKYRDSITLWVPNNTRIKVGFNKKLYAYLLTVLPEEHALALKHDYEMYIKK